MLLPCSPSRPLTCGGRKSIKHDERMTKKPTQTRSLVAPSLRKARNLVAPSVRKARNLYDPSREHDSCGMGFVANIRNRKSHELVEDGLTILHNMAHRGAVGADPKVGDGVGMLTQIPHAFFQRVTRPLGFVLPPPGQYAVGMCFLPQKEKARRALEYMMAKAARAEGWQLLGWRDVPRRTSVLARGLRASEPVIRQFFLRQPENKPPLAEADFERALFILRRRMELRAASMRAHAREIAAFYYICSLSCRIVLYKGQLLSSQFEAYYKDIVARDFMSAMVLIHQRFSTNTFPSWRLTQPFRLICHNGEINTLRGNVNWMAARHESLQSDLFGKRLNELWPLIPDRQSDSACFDNALELLLRGGYSLPQAMMMLVPEAWDDNPMMDKARRAFYEYHAALMEPWDGPAAIAFSDGVQIGATLDRNGLRPARYMVTKDDRVVMASEAGVLPVPDALIKEKWRLQPGRMLLIDLARQAIVSDEALKREMAEAQPYQKWLDECQLRLEHMPPPKRKPARKPTDAKQRLSQLQAFGYTQEDEKFLLAPMLRQGEEAIGSMGSDTPLPVLADRPRLLYNYFKQNFAQVTNPPIDPIRENLVMSLLSFIGPRPNLFDMDGRARLTRLEVPQPILHNEDLEKIRAISAIKNNHFHALTLDATWPAQQGRSGLPRRLAQLCKQAEAAIGGKENILILSDRAMGASRVPIPALLACSAIHHHLIRKGLRTQTGLLVETGEAREVHHFCCLAGYGAEAVNPWLAFELIGQRAAHYGLSANAARTNYVRAIGKGLLKTMSKMGISTYQSYCGAQIFDAVGLSESCIEAHFTKTASQIGGIGVLDIADDALTRHARAYGNVMILRDALEVGGEYAYRLRGARHAWNSESVAGLQHAVRGRGLDAYLEWAEKINAQDKSPLVLRDVMALRSAQARGAKPIPLAQVEPAAALVKRFATGAMSFGSISEEAHTTLAIAMNRLGGQSNTGEGGEDPKRFRPMPNGDSQCSAIKQVASGRFGVTAEYLANADMIQIKMAQGAKPGEGGQLPGHKVDAYIAQIRHSTPGVGLISPPPHHDIYSIEDLAQLIFDLKNANPSAAISVKLVSEVGVGTVAAGVAKARADHITISGFEGGTGASPLTSIKHAGSPWEIGLAETHQTLVRSGLRSRVALQVDGGLRTGRDVLTAALLGADGFGLATAPLIAAGCVMMRKCHLNTCPVGIATQDPILRQRFRGAPEHVTNYFFFVAEEMRRLMAQLGVRRLNQLIGRSDWLAQRTDIRHRKARQLDLRRLLLRAESREPTYHCRTQKHPIAEVLDRRLIELAEPALAQRKRVRAAMPIRNRDRTAGAMLSGVIAKRYGHGGLPAGTIQFKFTGSAGQSFGAFLAKGVHFELEGESNDYVGKGLSGGRLVVYPPRGSTIVPEKSILIGNTVLYGAVSGECYFRGIAGERFAVRNSGALAVVEGTGDHACEYMTGGLVAILGRCGRNLAAGMSGGIAYVLDEEDELRHCLNPQMVSLEPVRAELASPLGASPASLLAEPLVHDAARVKRLLQNHLHYTGSQRARSLLADWPQALKHFRKIVPNDFRRALQEQAAQTAAPPRALAGA